MMRAEFPDLCTAVIWGWVSHCARSCPWPLSSILGLSLYPLGANSTPLVGTTKNVSRQNHLELRTGGPENGVRVGGPRKEESGEVSWSQIEKKAL